MKRNMFGRIAAMIAIAALSISLSIAAHAQGDPKSGGQAYRVCAACHSLQPGVHLSGPSLADLWGKKAASVGDFGRYTTALKKTDIVWNENTLNAWLADPRAMVPGTTMAFRGIKKDGTRANLIAFLRVALAKDGLARAVRIGLVSKRMAMGQIPPDLSTVAPGQKITSIRHCRNAYHLSTADGAQMPFWESNLRIKIDTSARGPKGSGPVLLRSGMVGDRVSVVFSSLAQLKRLLAEKC